MVAADLLKTLEFKQYAPVNGLSERIYYPLILRGQAVLVILDELGLCLTKPEKYYDSRKNRQI